MKKRKKKKKSQKELNIKCSHEFDCDGGPCLKCGKTWIEINNLYP